jgi:hypothetical protein
MSNIFEYNKSLTDIMCENIIEYFEEDSDKNIFNIPKYNKKWERIERLLYKELLMRINDYKNKLLEKINLNNELLLLLNNELYTKNFSIQKIGVEKNEIIDKYIFIPNRYNVLTYIFYLNDIEHGGEIVFIPLEDESLETYTIKPKKGKIVLFPENINTFKYNVMLPVNYSQYIITGQLCCNII